MDSEADKLIVIPDCTNDSDFGEGTANDSNEGKLGRKLFLTIEQNFRVFSSFFHVFIKTRWLPTNFDKISSFKGPSLEKGIQ